MSRLTLKRATAKNFRSIGNLPVNINYEKLGNLTLVHSELNGSGKSTLFVQLIIYALKGKAYNAKSKIGHLVNLNNKRNCVVELEFTYGADVYIVRRGQKPRVFELIKNNKLLPTSIDYQQQLDELIGTDLSFDMLVNSIILSPSRYTPFRRQTKKQREEFLDYIFRTHVYTPMIQNNKTDIKDAKLKLEDIMYSIHHTEELINSKKNAITKFNETKANMSDDIQSKINILIQTKDDILDNINKLDSSCVDKQHRMNLVIEQLNDNIVSLTTEINNILLIEQNKLSIIKLKQCNNCNQNITEDLKTQIKHNVNRNLERLAPKKEQLSKLKNNLTVLNNNIKEINNDVLIYNKKLQNLKYEYDIIESKISTFNNQLKFQDDTFQSTLEEYQKELSLLLKTKDEYSTKETDILEELSILVEAKEFLFNVNIRTEIMSNYVPYINSILNNYLKEMEFFIEVNIDKDYNIIVTSTEKEGLSIHDLSDGERSKIDLAFILVWKQIQDQITQDLMNIFILDETLSNFSPQSVKDFLVLVRKVLPNHKIIVILQHPSEFIETFDSIVELKIENNFTVLKDDISINDLISSKSGLNYE
jgi:DNA repair exonuclease SbcCD ATPase subunit